MKSPLVSVIVPTYNRPDTLAEALYTVAVQNYPNIETIVVNDAGLDIADLLEPFRSRMKIKYLRHNQNKERSAARNTGLRAAEGKYIAYLDDDDLYYPQHIETLVTFLEQSDFKVAYSDAYMATQQMTRGNILRNIAYIREYMSIKAAVFYSLLLGVRRSHLSWLDSRLRFLARNILPPWPYSTEGPDMFLRASGKYAVIKRELSYSSDFDYDRILVHNFVPLLCVMHEKACLDEVGLFDETLTIQEDWDLWIRMSRIYRFGHVRTTTCEFAWRNDGSTTSSKKGSDFFRTGALIYERYRQYAQAKPHVLAEQKKHWLRPHGFTTTSGEN